MEVDPVLDKHRLALEVAQKNIHVADHMLNMTFKLVNDPKLLLLVLERLTLSLKNAMGSVLYLERKYKRIPPFSDDMDTMLSIFRARCTRRYNFDEDYAEVIQNVCILHKEHTQSPVEFRRGEQYVICSENLRVNVLSSATLQRYIEKTKAFIKDVREMIEKYEIHRRC